MKLASRIHVAEDLEAAIELCYRERWTDGLPVVPPTQGAVERMLDCLGRDPQEALGRIPPRNGLATLEKIAINAVMAGCTPGHLPVVIAALEAMLDERFNLNGVQTSTHSCAPLVMVSGPRVEPLGFNTREGALGHGSRTDAAIGRAIRLALWNIGGGYPGEPCKTTLGHPGYYSFCVAEDAAANPWEPLHVERGYGAGETVVTVCATEAPHSVGTGAGEQPADDVLYVLADAIAVLGSCTSTAAGDTVLVLGPMTARRLAEAGLSKHDVKRAIQAQAKRPAADMARRRSLLPEGHPLHWRNTVDAEGCVPFVRDLDDLVVLTTGGWGSAGGLCAVCPGWGIFGGRATSRAITFPD